LRTAVVLSYAHWEGFIKSSSMAFLGYLTYRKPALSDLKDNFIALYCREKLLIAAKASKRIEPHLHVVHMLGEEVANGARCDKTLSIDTESNLNGDVLNNICLSLGLDGNPPIFRRPEK